MNTSLAGRQGEAIAAEYLRGKKYTIIAAGYRCRFGEIDLIASKGDIVAFVEVKLRKDDRFAKAYEAVTPAKMGKIKITASKWLSENSGNFQPRFDIIEVYTGTGRLNHIENAFE